MTFIDPVCRSLCPLEAKQLNSVVTASPTARRPAIVAVSVNPWMQSRSIFRQDERKWRLVRRVALGWHGGDASQWTLMSKDSDSEYETRYRALFENPVIGIRISSVADGGRIVEANPAYQKMLGYSAAELRERAHL